MNKNKILKIYKDSSLKEEIVDTFDLGIVQAGDRKEYEYYVYNDSKAELKQLKFSVTHKEVVVISYPDNLNAKQGAKLVIKWSPSLTLKEGLKTKLKVNGAELWGPDANS